SSSAMQSFARTFPPTNVPICGTTSLKRSRMPASIRVAGSPRTSNVVFAQRRRSRAAFATSKKPLARPLLRDTARAMSQENVEIVRRWIEAYNRRDFEGLTELTEPDFEMKSLFVPIEGDFRGYAALDAYFEAVDEAYEHLLSVPEEFIYAVAAVVVVTNLDWRGKGSDA